MPASREECQSVSGSIRESAWRIEPGPETSNPAKTMHVGLQSRLRNGSILGYPCATDQFNHPDMLMIMMPEITGPKPTISYAMPTTMPARGHAFDAQQEFAYSQLSEDPARDEWGADSLEKHTTTKSNIYSYVKGNPALYTDCLRLRPNSLDRPLCGSRHDRFRHFEVYSTSAHGRRASSLRHHVQGGRPTNLNQSTRSQKWRADVRAPWFLSGRMADD